MWQADTGEKLGTLAEGLTDCFCVAFSPDDKLLATSRLSGVIELREASTGKLIRILKRHQGKRLRGEIDALGAVPVITTTAGINALTHSEHVKAIFEDQKLFRVA